MSDLQIHMFADSLLFQKIFGFWIILNKLLQINIQKKKIENKIGSLYDLKFQFSTLYT